MQAFGKPRVSRWLLFGKMPVVSSCLVRIERPLKTLLAVRALMSIMLYNNQLSNFLLLS
jgi:hypothetical protein